MKRVSAGICSCGCTNRMPIAEQQHHAQLHERAEVIARREQQPDRQRAGQKAIDDDGERQRHRATA